MSLQSSKHHVTMAVAFTRKPLQESNDRSQSEWIERNFENTEEWSLSMEKKFPIPYLSSYISIYIFFIHSYSSQICLEQYEIWDLKTPADALRGDAKN